MSTVTAAQLSREFIHVSTKAERAVGKVVKKTAVEIKKIARANSQISGGSHAARAHAYINFDMLGITEAEIGYDKSGQGNLGSILEFGTSVTSPKNDLGRAMQAEAPNHRRYVIEALDSLW